MLALASLWQYFTYRYRIDRRQPDRASSGLFERSLRQIPFARIHNVAVHQSLLHRLFGVAEVRLESAGGKKPEAQMRVLKLDDAIALEQLVRRSSHVSAARWSRSPRTIGDLLLQLPPAEVLRLGLISNRGLVVVGAGVAALSQVSPRLLPNLFEDWGKTLFGLAGSQQFDFVHYALAGASLLAGLVLLLRLFSVLLALLQYYGFRLEEHGRRLTVERGLLTRWRTSVPRRRIQAWTLREGVMHRLLKRRTLEIDTAVAEEQNESARATRTRAGGHARRMRGVDPAPAARSRVAAAAMAAAACQAPGGVCCCRAPSSPLLLCAVLAWRFGAWGLLGLLLAGVGDLRIAPARAARGLCTRCGGWSPCVAAGGHAIGASPNSTSCRPCA